ncbi:hypothetical protein IL306_001807 [Fusarium sp. DS 682]|nr:hypothetical protein IL306_001807 [Fusarium sp. DS 682]
MYRPLPDRLTTHAQEVEEKCGEMFAQLDKYKADTQDEDLHDIMEIDKRLKKIIPDAEAQKSQVQKFVDQAKYMLEAARNVLEAEYQRAREQGQVKWYRVTETIDNALLAVGKMQTTFSKLQTDFQSIKKKLNNATSDVNQDFAFDYDLPLGDLKDSAITWKRVHYLSQIFQSTGIVLDGKDAPGQEENEKAA